MGPAWDPSPQMKKKNQGGEGGNPWRERSSGPLHGTIWGGRRGPGLRVAGGPAWLGSRALRVRGARSLWGWKGEPWCTSRRWRRGELIITHLTGTTPIDRPVYRETLDVAGWTWEPGDHEHREHTAGNLEHARARRRWESGKQNGSLATHASFRFARQSCKAEVGGRAMDVDGGDLLSWLSAVGQEACWEGVM